ncbi:MAG TPA: hypothetical protein VFJ64_09080 [Solirubrobacterales bacterium]|nr:hypothetical protein [Solirubrobacterales bacterium]
MSDLVLDAVQVLTPLLAAGADDVVAEATRQAGEGAATAARRVLEAVRRALGGKDADKEAVTAALRGELNNGTVTEGDLLHTVKVFGAGRDNYGIQVKGKKTYIGNSIHVEGGDFHG